MNVITIIIGMMPQISQRNRDVASRISMFRIIKKYPGLAPVDAFRHQPIKFKQTSVILILYHPLLLMH